MQYKSNLHGCVRLDQIWETTLIWQQTEQSFSLSDACTSAWLWAASLQIKIDWQMLSDPHRLDNSYIMKLDLLYPWDFNFLFEVWSQRVDTDHSGLLLHLLWRFFYFEGIQFLNDAKLLDFPVLNRAASSACDKSNWIRTVFKLWFTLIQVMQLDLFVDVSSVPINQKGVAGF